jgi:hypothetical protein
MAKQYGTVLIFKKEISREEIIQKLASIGNILDTEVPIDPKNPFASVLVSDQISINEFDNEYEAPVWYCP